MRLTTGEFSRVTSLSLKSLRLYHEKGILVPAAVDADTGYRYYDQSNLERARSIEVLKRFDFTLTQIKALLDECDDEADMLVQLQGQLQRIQGKIDRFQEISHALGSIIQFEKESAMDRDSQFQVEERELDTILIAGHRMLGKYEDVGKGLGFVCRKMGRHSNGKPMALYYDDEYKEDGADFEACVPVRKGKDIEGISVRELKGGRCVSLVHKGPYETIRASYQRVFTYLNEHSYEWTGPIREVYRKGPGLILKGNPRNYLTEIQILITGRRERA